MYALLSVLFILTIVLLILYYVVTARNLYWKKKGVPFLPPVPVLGNYSDYILLKKYVGHVTQNLCDKFPGVPYFGSFYGTEPTLVVKNPELIKLVLTKDFYYFSGREISKYSHKEVFTTNIFFSGGDRWKVQRQNLTPLFSSSKMKNMFYLLEKCAHSFEKMLADELKDSAEIEIRNLMARFTMGGIGSCAFGVDTRTMDRDQRDNSFLTLGLSIFEGTNYRGFKTVFRAIWPSLFYEMGFKSFPRAIDDFFSDLLTTVFRDRGHKPSPRKDFVDLILTYNENSYIQGDSLSNMKDGGSKKASIKVDNELLVAQCITFFAAGFETSAITLTFILFELAKNQDAQKRAQDEIDDFLKRHNNHLTYDCVKELPYLEACIYESLRMYPSLGILTREVIEDYTLPSGLSLEKGLRVHIPVSQLHHNPDYFPEPELFWPERFLPENKADIKPYTFFPFGEGPRICIGK